jgi:D-arabinose 5-phosphate isomerase GutQ/sugar/nucleoside kinase (ribokinase family)/dihydrodipicolinate synthase/N-acetylneuraminate lyase
VDYTLPAPPLIKGLCVPMLTALDSQGRFDAASQEKLIARLLKGEAGAGAQALFSNGTSGEWHRLSADLGRQAAQTAQYALSGGGPSHWVGCTAASAGGVLANIEHAIKIGASSVVVAPLAVEDIPDSLNLFHRHISPLYQRLGKGLPVFLYDNPSEYKHGQQDHLKTREVKQLARLDYVCGAKVTADPKVAGNYLRAARQSKARHEFGVYLGSGTQVFSLFQPSDGMLGNLRERWRRYWVSAEPPQGVVPGSSNLFPSAWRQAWAACVAGDTERMAAFEAAFHRLHGAFFFSGVNKSVACMKAALAEEGVLAGPTVAAGTASLNPEERSQWLLAYRQAKKELGGLTGAAISAPVAAPRATVSTASAQVALVGFGAAVVDEIIPVAALLGPDTKQKTLGPSTRHAGGVVLNQLAWARALGLSSGIAGLSGSDEGAAYLRQEAAQLGVDTAAWTAAPGLTADIARIFVTPDGERSIYLQPGATCRASVDDAKALAMPLKNARYLVTEVSLLPLKAVAEALAQAASLGKESFLDLDVPPKLATGAQGLGTAAELRRCLESCTHLKAGLTGAKQLLPGKAAGLLALGLHKKFKKAPGSWVAVTGGKQGAWLSDGTRTYKQAAFKVKVTDSTGCGDAFHGALIAARSVGMAPGPALKLACAAGAVAATQVGAVPSSVARPAVLKLFGQPWPLVDLPRRRSAGSEAGEHLRVAQSELAAWAAAFSGASLEQAKTLILEAESASRRVHVTGVGKCEYVAGYVASSYSSTGTPAFFLHATEAGHGASGQVRPGDVVIAVSNSGETDELKAAVSTLKKNGAKILGVSGKPQSWLARHSDAFLWAGVRREGDDLNLAPRNSVMVEIVALNALGVALQQHKKFTAEQFKAFHPGGSLGKVEL